MTTPASMKHLAVMNFQKSMEFLSILILILNSLDATSFTLFPTRAIHRHGPKRRARLRYQTSQGQQN